ncbi:MAG TPA: single-stranded-DNA-specific exonuclease RecJ, partial [Deltaproteobacteria bacterium]|nr:single-stranded-DNA-specific exonuclease RecJ [Deltaproteobacteria bacterium]
MSDSGSGDSKKAKGTWTIRGKLDKRAFPDLKFSPVFKSLMKIRGLETSDDIMHFVMPSLGDLRDPVLMKGMNSACERISRALERNEKIGLFTDYDVDGVCSAALIYLFFIKLGYPPPPVFIPDRATDGYGLNTRGIEELHAKGVSLLITADCGINAIEEVVYAKSLGMDVIITDHHEPDTKLPDAYSIINPKQGDCPFADQDLCGAGVVFHLMVALRAFLRAKGMESLPNLREDLDLVAMATIADVVSLSGINRILVKEGLKVLNEGKRVGISALADVSGIRSTVIARDIGYILGPRINAAGRISNAYKSFELLTTDDPHKARGIAMELHMLNRQRQAEEQKVFKDVLAMVEDSGNTSEAIV